MTEQELQEKRRRNDAGIILQHEVEELLDEVDKKSFILNIYSKKNERLRFLLEDIVAGHLSYDEIRKEARKALEGDSE